MLLKTSKGNEYEVAFVDGPTITSGHVMLQMNDTRPLWRIAQEFEGIERLERFSDTQGDKAWEGYTLLQHVSRVNDGVVRVALAKP